MEPFHNLGLLVERRWRDRNYVEEALPEIAVQALADAALHERVDPWDILRWLHETPALPFQQDPESIFGDLAVTLFRSPRFFIAALYWLDGTTAIHQHSFSGAFQVLTGSSVQTRYRFDVEREINPQILTGRIVPEDTELLETGAVRPIVAGGTLIHSLFHLDRPSVTIVVRTYETVTALPQYKYLRPAIAYDPFFQEQSLARKLQSVSLLIRMRHPQRSSIIGELLSAADFFTTFSILHNVFHHEGQDALEKAFGIGEPMAEFAHLLEVARRRHGALVDAIVPVFDEQKRQLAIIQRRGHIKDAAHRFFLALLLNAVERESALAMVRRRFPDEDPVDIIVDWIEELSATRVLGSQEESVLGLPPLDDLSASVLRCLLGGLSAGQLEPALARDYPVAMVREMKEELESKAEALRRSVLAPLLD